MTQHLIYNENIKSYDLKKKLKYLLVKKGTGIFIPRITLFPDESESLFSF